jgi:hypothetical protein
MTTQEFYTIYSNIFPVSSFVHTYGLTILTCILLFTLAAGIGAFTLKENTTLSSTCLISTVAGIFLLMAGMFVGLSPTLVTGPDTVYKYLANPVDYTLATWEVGQTTYLSVSDKPKLILGTNLTKPGLELFKMRVTHWEELYSALQQRNLAQSEIIKDQLATLR